MKGRWAKYAVTGAMLAMLAEREGADYLGVGAVFPTGTKADANAVSYDTLRDICAAVSIPVIAIGGITKDNVARLSGSGIVGVVGGRTQDLRCEILHRLGDHLLLIAGRQVEQVLGTGRQALRGIAAAA